MAMRWYVVHAHSNFEKAAKRSLEERVERAHPELKNCFGRDENNKLNVLVPSESVTEIREGQKRTVERKLYPGYVLVQMDMEREDIDDVVQRKELRNELWHLVKDTARVVGFIGGTQEHPAPLKEKEVTVILQRVLEGAEKPRPKVLFETGEVVRVIDGPFNDFNGVVEEVNYEKNRLRVAVLIFGRSTPVELEFSQVEKEN
ncbi:transcription termination/antitermination protein NusG [Beggiatoa leptomitoformis]|uniref:Transcription termination/antitermination protein NusG n=1 Tax=Beggiatoa leptomitoformis TaxID=288004 RepID=A0A2N9YH29_9GAMM|nr:transcription termination/antitermination protein NusG [Beggiatoa leptomitoformis]ALG67922.1 transcription termination/antitermination protein NusG [Beggiatoa leptomitoformis]AUI69807.1 transcription termination/antitermination protein NusG [Beggiatoa leptomitoformis]